MKSILSLAIFMIVGILMGCDGQTALEPEAPPDLAEPPQEQALTPEERALLAGHGVSAGKGNRFVAVSQAPVLTIGEEHVGRSRQIRFHAGVLASVQTSELEPGTAATLWMVVFNAPEHCSDGACGSDDLRNPDVRADLLWVDGAVIGPSGRARYGFFKRRADTEGSIADPLWNAPAYGVEDPLAAEIHYVVRTHGPVIPGFEYEMTHTFNGCCTLGSLPDDPRLGPVGPNTCENIQFTIHTP